MASDTTRTRRSVLGTVGAALAGTGIISTTATAAGSEADEQPSETAAQPPVERNSTPEQAGRTTNQQYSWYNGTVDRIVDDRHVVILLESDGRVVDQVVVDRAELQRAQEGDQVLVLRSADEVVTIVRLS